MESGHAASLEVRVVPPTRVSAVADEFSVEQGEYHSRKVDYLEAFEAERSVGFLGLEWSAGGNVWLWGPKIKTSGMAPAGKVARALLGEAQQRISQQKATLAHVMLDPSQLAEASWYTEFGYDKQITLELLVYPLAADGGADGVDGRTANPAPAESVCQSIAYKAQFHTRFSKALAASYAESQDCLAIHRQSDPETALADYRDTSLFNPDHWRLFQSANEDFGCLLMTHHAAEASLEMVYLGLKPAFRGRGWGHWATSIAVAEAKRLDCRQLTVAVDSQNAAARRLYTGWGFWCFDRKSVLIRTDDSWAIGP